MIVNRPRWSMVELEREGEGQAGPVLSRKITSTVFRRPVFRTEYRDRLEEFVRAEIEID